MAEMQFIQGNGQLEEFIQLIVIQVQLPQASQLGQRSSREILQFIMTEIHLQEGWQSAKSGGLDLPHAIITQINGS